MISMRGVVLTMTLASLCGLALVTAQSTTNTFRVIPLPNSNERVTGVYCSSAKACVIATDVFGGAGHLYASDGQRITRTLLTGDKKLAERLGTLREVNFTGFSKVGNRLIAHVTGEGASFVSATGDITQAASWSAVKVGVVQAGDTFGMNQQMGMGTKDGRWVHFTLSTVYETTDEPGPGAFWTPVWAPLPPKRTPSDFEGLRRADPKLCEAEPGTSLLPRLTQLAYVAPNLSVILYPSGARNQRGSSPPGVCVSTDGGKRFFNVPFAGVPEGYGPLGVTCSVQGKCFAYGGLDYTAESVFIYASSDVGRGVASTWAQTKLPTLRANTKFRGLSLTPDGASAWAVGWNGSSDALVLNSGDGGQTWRDVTASVRALAGSARLHTVYAFDAAHVWIGGEGSTLLTSGN
jgi:hypothetical protein